MTSFQFWSNDPKGQKAEELIITKNPYDVNLWMVLIQEAQIRSPQDSRIIFERAISQFPGCYRFLKFYIEKESKDGDESYVIQLYERFLPSIPNVDLFIAYLQHFKKTIEHESDYYERMINAYEFAVNKVGFDFSSFPIWNDYIQLLRSNVAMGTFAEGQKHSSIRRLYSRILSIPINNVEIMWKDYCAFEQGINKASGEKIAADRLRDFNHIRKVSKELECLLKGIIRVGVPIPPQETIQEKRQIEQWQKYINWEKKNPLNLDDDYLIAKRVIYGYEQFLQHFAFHTSIWISLAQYIEKFYRKTLSEGDKNRADELAETCRDIYRRGVNGPMHESLIFNLCYADFEEIFHNFNICVEIYEKLLTKPDTDKSLVYVHYMKFIYRTKGSEDSRLFLKRCRFDKNIDFRIYINAALREFYCNRNPVASIKLFESAIKSFPNSFELLSLYFIHLRRLSELHKFESHFGCLNSCLELEDRILEKCPNSDPLKLVLDRYSLSFEQLSNLNECSINSKLKSKESFIPDLSQMRAFKPINPHGVSLNLPSIIIGGVFPPPPRISELLSRLPPPLCFQGPFVEVDALIYHIINMNDYGIENTNDREDVYIENSAESLNPDSKLLDDLYRCRQESSASKVETTL